MRDRQICIGGKWSGDDLGVEITAGGFGDPPPRNIRETVAGMDGSYDFSKIDGQLHYDDRKGSYTFCIRGRDAREAGDIKAALLVWFGSGDQLYDENVDGYIYTDVSCTGTDEPRIVGDERRTILLTAHFTAAPYMRSRNGQLIDCLDLTPNAAATRYLFSIFRPSQAAPVLYYLSRMVGYGSGGMPSGYVSYDETSHSGSVIAATPRVTFPVSSSNPMYHIMPKQMSGTTVSVSDCSGGSVVKETDTYIYFTQNSGAALSIGISGFDAQSLADESVRAQVTTQIRYAGWLYPDDRQSFQANTIPGTGNMRIVSEADVALTIDPPSGETAHPEDISDFSLSPYDLLTLTGAKDQLCKLQYNTVRLRR